jgi:hypothetical protein
VVVFRVGFDLLEDRAPALLLAGPDLEPAGSPQMSADPGAGAPIIRVSLRSLAMNVVRVRAAVADAPP